MAQEYKVAKAFQSTVSKEDKTPQVVNTQGGAMHKFMVQVENQPIPGWISILKKQGNEVKQGDTIYGDISENNWGKPDFRPAQRPQGDFAGNQPPRSTGNTPNPSQSQGGNSEIKRLSDKIDYLTGLVENFLNQQNNQTGTPDQSTWGDEGDDQPADLSEIDY